MGQKNDMESGILELKSLKMLDEAVKKTAKETAKQTTLDNIEIMKQLGFPISEEQKQKLLKHAMEIQGIE